MMKRRSSSLTSLGEQEEEEGQRCDRRQSLRKKKRVHYKDPDDNNEDDDDDDYDDDDEEEDENYDDTPPYSWDKDVEMWPVICGSKEGMMDVKKLAKSEECIECEGRLFSPPAFEEFGGKGSSKKWKTSIYSGGKPLQYWFDEGLLVTGRFKGAKTFKKRIKNYQNNGYKSSYTTRQNGSLGGSNHSGESEAEITEDSEEEDISERHSGTENRDLSMEEEEGRVSVRNDGDYVNSDHSEEKQDDKLDQDEMEDDWEEFDNPENIFAPKEADPRLIISTPEKLALQMRVNVMIEKMPSVPQTRSGCEFSAVERPPEAQKKRDRHLARKCLEKHKDSRSEKLLKTPVTEDSGELIENERADMSADPSPRHQPSEEEIGESLRLSASPLNLPGQRKCDNHTAVSSLDHVDSQKLYMNSIQGSDHAYLQGQQEISSSGLLTGSDLDTMNLDQLQRETLKVQLEVLSLQKEYYTLKLKKLKS